jgi:hypothetical protein
MKPLIALFALGLIARSAFGGPEIIIKQRAKELNNQNNVRQGVTPAQPAAPQAARPAVPTAAAAQQQNVAKLKADLAKIKAKSQITTEQKQQLTRDLLGVAQGATKPSSAAVAKLANDLSAAMADKTLGAAEQARLVQDLVGVLNGANISPSQTQAIAADVQAIFQANGLARNEAATIANDLKAVAGEIQTAAKK